MVVDEDLLFADEEEFEPAVREPQRWRILIVDDEEEVHTVTRLVLNDFTFEGRKLDLISAYSGKESLELLRDTEDIAVVLLDVVMEDNHAGLEVARRIREDLNNPFTRIILRTGQPGQAPENKVISELDINDYKQKTELTAQKLFVTMTTALRSFRDLKTIETNRNRLLQLAMSVAHQIRNRTMSIAGFANIAVRELMAGEDVVSHLDTIRTEASRLEAMVASVSDFASLSRGAKEDLLLKPVIDEAYAATEKKLASKEISFADVATLSVNVNDLRIEADRDLIVRMLQELLMNAVVFRNEDCHITITAEPLGEGCILKIKDNGVGMSPETVSYIFDPFFSSLPDGVGMGLCTVRKIVDEHGWEISVSSTEHKGSTFEIVIPFLSGRAPREENKQG
ncbi:ATP-binding response regulator [Halodesulfovibrio marinisediminis]|uniref:histidine kinase n=1 Tax=Halodesulfovibrio marinisediminis DSM 17456 TaxID=1121457 RepID=A0A1N6DEL8_9BACT|nr:hybrid sensor histidine kinase/response regulator [Halodesulfovibrio marinisediminis]SIN69241.1 Signal transduction histidine kinase [Halodesulfovibrio marinisediminis DSM 17456]